MKKFITLFLITIFTFSSFTNATYANDTDEWNEIVNALNKELDEVYNPYFEIVDQMYSDDEEIYTQAFNDFFESLDEWDLVFDYTTVVYSRYINSSDSEKAEVAQLGLESAELAKQSLALYTEAIVTEDPVIADELLQEADDKFYDAVDQHDVAITLYNDYSGVNSSFSIRNILIGITALLGIISLVLFLKSRTNSNLESDKVKSQICKNLLSGTFGMTIGLGITVATYAWAIENGGSYFIFYGPVLGGLINLFKQIGWFLGDGRKALKEIKERESNAIVSGVNEVAPTMIK